MDRPGARFRALLETRTFLHMPSVYDALGGDEKGLEYAKRKGYEGDRLHATLVPGGIHRDSAWAERFPDVMRFWLGG